jgi:hypothetical protein
LTFRDKTYIIIFDSLNQKRRKAEGWLARYLQLEATNKMKIDSPISPEVITAHVRALAGDETV